MNRGEFSWRGAIEYLATLEWSVPKKMGSSVRGFSIVLETLSRMLKNFWYENYTISEAAFPMQLSREQKTILHAILKEDNKYFFTFWNGCWCRFAYLSVFIGCTCKSPRHWNSSWILVGTASNCYLQCLLKHSRLWDEKAFEMHIFSAVLC